MSPPPIYMRVFIRCVSVQLTTWRCQRQCGVERRPRTIGRHFPTGLRLLAGLPVLRGASHSEGVALFDAFYRSGALVFGGSHLVLPLPRILGRSSGHRCMDLRARRSDSLASSCPGMLILVGTLSFWDTFRRRSAAHAAMRGVNASVVGLLGAALYTPIWTSSVRTPADCGVALARFVLLVAWRTPPLVIVVVSALGSISLAQTLP